MNRITTDLEPMTDVKAYESCSCYGASIPLKPSTQQSEMIASVVVTKNGGQTKTLINTLDARPFIGITCIGPGYQFGTEGSTEIIYSYHCFGNNKTTTEYSSIYYGTCSPTSTGLIWLEMGRIHHAEAALMLNFEIAVPNVIIGATVSS